MYSYPFYPSQCITSSLEKVWGYEFYYLEHTKENSEKLYITKLKFMLSLNLLLHVWEICWRYELQDERGNETVKKYRYQLAFFKSAPNLKK